MEDQRANQKSDGRVERSRFSSGLTIAVLIIAPLCLPLVLIGVAMLETAIFGSASLCKAYDRVGIFEPLVMIHDAIVSLFGR
jgi:hypothetical protein